MLKATQKIKDAEKLMLLIPKMRRGECDVLETWFIQECLKYRRGLTKEVTRLLREVPDDSSPQDAWLRGAMAWWGAGEKKDVSRAAQILKPHEQDPLCAALLGPMYQYGAQTFFTRAAEMLLRSAEAGCAEGLYQLVDCYLEGRGVRMDGSRAYEACRRAVEMLHPGAMWRHAYVLRFGVGVEPNTHLAVRSYDKACSYGHAVAHSNLGVFYRDGRGVAVDKRRAASLFRKAIVLGHEKAQQLLDKLAAEDAIPWGEWCPDPLMHNYVPDSMHNAMRTVLLMRSRPGTLFAQLPKDIVIKHILFWICTEPYEEPVEDKWCVIC